MSTPASWRERVDPRLREQLELAAAQATVPVVLRGHVVLVGHRAAGKSALLGLVARALSRPAVDLDALIAARTAMTARELFERSEAHFRAAEREAFLSVRGEAVIAAGGGFLSHHADLLRGHTAVLVPVSFETYRARLLADTGRPRLRPALSLDAEIARVFAEREAAHRRVPTVPLAALMRELHRGLA